MTRRQNRAGIIPAVLVSVLVHIGLAAALFFLTPPAKRNLPFGSAVPVNIVSDAPMTDVAPAVEGPEAPAQLEDPLPDEPPAVPEPPAPTPPEQKKAEAKPPPNPNSLKKKQQQTSVDFDALQNRLNQQAGGGQDRRGGGVKGPNKPQAAPVPRPDGKGKGVNASSMAGLVDELQRRWNPNCDVEGGRSVKVSVQVLFAPSGFLIGEPKIIRQSGAAGLTQAGSTRAISAVKAAQPFRNLPDEMIGEKINLNFDANKACAL